jgi:hypothetical protein
MSEMNKLFKWIDEAIAKKHIKHYEYKKYSRNWYRFGKVYRAK